MSLEKNGLIIVNYPKRPYILYEIRSENKKDIGIYIGVTCNYIERCYKHSKNREYDKYKDKPLYIWMNDVIDNQKLKVKMKIIEEGYTEEEAFEREKELICMYRWNKFNVLNVSDGGKGYTGNVPWNKDKKDPYSQEQLKRLSESHIGQRMGKRLPHSQETKELIKFKMQERKERGWKSPNRKKVYKYDENKNLLNIYDSVTDASLAEKSNVISIKEWCNGTVNPRNKFRWSFVKLN